jgi:uncharacterized protein with gpF-like domain
MFLGMELVKRFSKFAHSAGALISIPKAGAPPDFLLAPLRKLGLSAPFSPTPTAVKVYQAVISRNVAFIERLPSKYRKDAEEVIWNSVMKGYDVAGLARELHDRFGIVQERAQLIAGAQCRMARSVMENAHRIEQGLTEAVWRRDARCEIETHQRLDGRPYVLARGAKLDGTRIWPSGDPRCWCTSSTLEATGTEENAA